MHRFYVFILINEGYTFRMVSYNFSHNKLGLIEATLYINGTVILLGLKKQ